MTCDFEEEDKACGRQVGLWAGKVAASPEAAENAAYSRNHMELRPSRCDLGPFDGRALAKALAGGRTLRIAGDSTMRQL
jgi:hypothetical protein